MKILIVSQLYYPEQFQINDIAPELHRRGHDVTVLTGLPNYPKGELFEGYKTLEECRAKDIEREAKDGVRIVRCKLRPRKRGKKNLMLNYLSFAYQATRMVPTLDDDFDVVLSYQLSPITMVLPAIAYKRRHHKPLLLYCLDLWPESALAHIKKSWQPIYKAIAWLSRAIYEKADRILVTSRPFIDYLHEKNGVPLDRMDYLPQHADTTMIDMDLKAEDNGVADFMFAGNLGAGQNLKTIIEAAAVLGARADYKIHFVGDGSQRAELERMAEELGLQDNIIFHGSQRREDMPRFYRMADALLITLRGNNAVGNTMPGKLQMYMTTGKPIFGAINGAANEVIAEARCGECVAAGDSCGLASIMEKYISAPRDYEACGERAKRYFLSHFTLQHYVDGLEKDLKKLL